MTLNRVRASIATVILAAAVGMAFMAGVGTSSADAAGCHTAVKNIEKRKKITCKQAKRVVRKVGARLGKRFPSSCRRQSARALGWKVKGIGGYEAYRFTKGRKSFVYSGMGDCRN